MAEEKRKNEGENKGLVAVEFVSDDYASISSWQFRNLSTQQARHDGMDEWTSQQQPGMPTCIRSCFIAGRRDLLVRKSRRSLVDRFRQSTFVGPKFGCAHTASEPSINMTINDDEKSRIALSYSANVLQPLDHMTTPFSDAEDAFGPRTTLEGEKD